MRKVTLVSLAFLALAGCAAPSGQAEQDDATSEAALIAKLDPTLVANAKAVFEAMLADSDYRRVTSIPYADLPGPLAAEVAAANPDPTRGWAAGAYRAVVLDGEGEEATVFGVLDDIFDMGGTITVYDAKARMLAQGDNYRGFAWKK